MAKKRKIEDSADGAPGGLLEVTLHLIDQRVREARGTQSRLAVLTDIATGAGVPLEWLRKAAAPVNATPNPGVLSVQRVHDFLTQEAP